MMKRVKRLTAALLAACLVVSLLPVGAAAAGTVHQVPAGTNLIEYLKSNNVADGDTLQLQGNVIAQDTDPKYPWIIQKKITINGNGHDLTANGTGIILGADVTFQNLNLGLTSTDSRNAIIANGYALVLDGVKAHSTARSINVFGGTLLKASYENFFEVPAIGTAKTVTIKGKTNLQSGKTDTLGAGNIFAGSLAMGGLDEAHNKPENDGIANTFPGDVTINIEDCADSSALGIVYAGGGQQRIPIGANSTKITVPNPNKYLVGGTVTVSGAAVPDVDGAGAARTNVMYKDKDSNNYEATKTFQDISNLDVRSGNLVLSQCSSFRDGAAVSVANDAILNFSELGNLTIGSFAGGGSLVLGETQTLNVAGLVTGSTSVAIGLLFNNASNTAARAGHSYIIAQQTGAAAFHLLPHSTQPNMELVREENGSWVARAGEGTEKTTIVNSIAFINSKTAVDANTKEATMFLEVLYADASDFKTLSIPVAISVGGQPTTMVDTDGVLTYTTQSGNLRLAVTYDSNEDKDCLCVTDISTDVGADEMKPITSGVYPITIDIPGKYTSTGKTLSASATLIVGDVQSLTDIPVPSPVFLRYTGTPQTGVPEGEGYTISGNTETNVGTYTATATLKPGYQWSIGTTVPQTISWAIAKAAPPAAPSGLSGTAPTAADTNDGKIIGTTTAMEYAKDVDFTVERRNCTDKETTNLAAGDYYVRLKETETQEAGNAYKVTVPAAGAEGQIQEISVPSARTDLKWTGEELTGVPEGTGYTLTGNKATDAGSYTATATLASNYQWSDGSATPKTIPWTIAKGEAPAAPTGLKGIAPTSASGANGKITGTETTMQYAAKADFTNAKDCAAGETTGLVSGSYYVRFKETNNHPAGLAAEVTVPKYDGGGDSGGGGSAGGGDIQEPVTTPQQTANAINAANSGSTVTMTLPSGNTVSRTVWQALAGKDVTLEIETGRFTWSVDGRDVDSKALPTSLNLGAKEGMDLIPASVLEQTPRGTETLQISLNHNGAFAVPLTLSVDLGRDNAQRWANLYYYNTTAKTMEFQSASLIGDNGRAAFPMDHASSYAVVVDRVSHGSEGGDDPFLDVSLGAWYYDVVRYVYQKGLMTGTGRDTFSPLSPVTRGQAVTTLYRMAGSPAAQGAGSFRDVAAGSYYADAVGWAVEKGVATGHSADRFAPDAPITREQLAALLCRYARVVEGKNVNVSAQVLLRFPDQGRVSAYAVQPMGWAVELGLIDGFQDGSLQPQGQANRAQLAAILSRFAER